MNLFAVVNPSGQFFSSIDTPEGKFQSSISLGETSVVSSADGGIAETPFVDDMNLQRLADEQPDAGASPRLAELTANPTVITVGILVDNTINENLDVFGLVDFLIGVANDSYQNSGLDIRFDVVAVVNYQPYISYVDMSTTLDWITCGSASCSPTSGINRDVRNWRDTNKADMVAQLVFRGTDAGICGMGQLPSDSFNITNRNNLIQYTYSVSAVFLPSSGSSCPGIVVAHEMGHNFGLFHDRETLSGQGWSGYPAPVYDYAFGYKVDGVFGTTMSYISSNYQLFYLSNPNFSYNGYPIGVPIGQPTPAFAARAVGNVMSYYGNIYDPVSVSHTVTASASAGASISPSGAVNVEEGQSLVFSLTLQQGYFIQGVTGCSGTLAGSAYTTGAIFSDCSVAAQFSVIVAPSTPQIINTDYGNGEIYISVSVDDDGGSPITSYAATCTDGTTQYTGTSSTSRITVSGLTNGVGYSCSVTATNAAGTSTSSASSPPIIPATLPDAPSIDSIAPGNGQAVITFAPAADNGSSITGNIAACFGDSVFFASSATSPITVSGLTNGVSYVCAMIAINDVGAGPAAVTEPVTPVAPPPGC